MPEYNAKNLIYNRWAPLKHLPGGHWQRTWSLLLKEEVRSQISLEKVSIELSEEGFKVVLTQNAPKRLTATVTTVEDGWDDRFFFATYRMFKRIDEKIGTIETIEDQPRDLWRPWRKG